MIKVPFCREKLCKASERMTDVLNIFEKVQMIGIHIQDHADFWEKAEKAVGIFAGLGHKGLRLPHTDIASDGRKNAAYADGRVAGSFQKDLGNHGSGCGLAMSTGNGDGCLVIAHDLPKSWARVSIGIPFALAAANSGLSGWIAAV